MLIKRSNNIFVIQNLKQKCSLKTANLICIFKIVWFLKAAEQGDPEAQYYLGLMYNKGFGLKQDYTEAMNWYLKAAEQDNKDALCSLANMYLEGEGVKQDYFKAFEWYQKAAEQGNADAQLNLGYMY